MILNTQGGFELEKLKQREDLERLTELADLGNIFAKTELSCRKSGLTANIQAFLKFPCEHIKELTNGRYIKTESWSVGEIREGFLIREKICTQCGKTLESVIRKPKRPRRRF